MNALPVRNAESRIRRGGVGRPRPWRCTGPDAVYCPIHHDCTCPVFAVDPLCALHGVNTTHPTAEEMVA